MFKLPNLPSAKAKVHELADFAELLCWTYGKTSTREIIAHLGREDDNDRNDGCNDSDDRNAESLDEVMNELERRIAACGTGYPFRLDFEGTVLRHSEEVGPRPILYRYLLLSTRINMKNNRIQGGIDGANLLEHIAAHALRNYLGKTRAKSFVFGTASCDDFQKKVENLCQNLREGQGFRTFDDAPTYANDDKLDAVAWVPFSDGLPGQLIIFGQCKTGSTWRGLTTQLQPEVFIKKWLRDPILVSPVRAFCISEAADRSRWRGTCTEAGILLDRCRLVDFCDDIATDLLEKVKSWTMAAKSSTVNY